jgi:hypothetical protein
LAAAAALPVSRARANTDLLDALERRACLYFIEQSNPSTGLVLDRAPVTGRRGRPVSSIAATGFGLSALCIADKRRYFKGLNARARVRTALEFLARSAPHNRGFFPHFLDVRNGRRIWNCEYSSVDTAWLLCGVLHAKAHFGDRTISVLADELLERVDWQWMLDNGPTLSHGWTPESGFLPYRWDEYSELMAMYILALASRSKPIPAESWRAWKRTVRTWDGITCIDSDAPLFVHQYSHAWFDFRGVRDGSTDYYENSRLATLAHRRYCTQWSWYSEDVWGVTASDSRQGYVAWGSPHSGLPLDGTVVPCAAGGSLAFLPDECTAVLRNLFDRYGSKIWGRYGFSDAYHADSGWSSPYVIGIDQGITLLMAENLRTGSVWTSVMQTDEARRGMAAAGFSPAA